MADIDRKYHDSDGNPCTLNQMTRREPEWAASRIRVGEEAIVKITRLRSELEAAKGSLWRINKYLTNLQPHIANGLLDSEQIKVIDAHVDPCIDIARQALARHQKDITSGR